jgi:hypothetical protein
MRCCFVSFFSLFVLFPQGVFSQNSIDTFGNAWIREGQTYVRLAVADDGLYRISSSSLEEVGVPVSEIPGHAYQLFRHGQEEPLWISSGEKPLGPADFVQFFGRRPRGELDALLLPESGTGLNPELSLYTDSNLYFLTWSVHGSTALRFSHPSAQNGNWRESVTVVQTRVFRESFMQPNYQSYLHDSRLESTEGFGSMHQFRHQWDFPAPGYLPAQGPAELTIRYVTQSDVPGRISFSTNGKRLATSFPKKAWNVQELTMPVLPSGNRLAFFAEAKEGA